MPLYSLYTSTIRFRHGLVEVGVSSVRPLTVATRLFQFANIQSCLFLYEEHWTTRMECAILEVQPQSSVPMERWLFASSSTAADGVSSTRPKSGDINACMVSLEVLSFFFQPFAVQSHYSLCDRYSHHLCVNTETKLRISNQTPKDDEDVVETIHCAD